MNQWPVSVRFPFYLARMIKEITQNKKTKSWIKWSAISHDQVTKCVTSVDYEKRPKMTWPFDRCYQLPTTFYLLLPWTRFFSFLRSCLFFNLFCFRFPTTKNQLLEYPSSLWRLIHSLKTDLLEQDMWVQWSCFDIIVNKSPHSINKKLPCVE